jgi:hypothetical protein
VSAALLLFERAVELILLNDALGQQQLPQRFSHHFRDHEFSPHGFQGGREIGLTFEPMLQPGDFQNLFHVFVEIDELQSAEELFAAPLHPKQRFQRVAVGESAFLKIDDKINDLFLVDVLFEGFFRLGGGFGKEITLRLDHANLAIFFALDAHGIFP